MSSATDRRKKSGGDGGGEGANWMDTYGDLVTLLLCFFVLLYAFSSVDSNKWQALVGAFTGVSVVPISPIPPEVAVANPVPEIAPPSSGMQSSGDANAEGGNPADYEEYIAERARLDENLRKLYESMRAYVKENDIDAEVVLIDDEYMVVLVMNDLVFFRTGEAKLLPESLEVLDKVVEMFYMHHDMYAKLSIEGHTDNRPINTARYPSNWDLSVDRALSVLYYIKDTGKVDPTRLYAGGFGEYIPIDTNDTEEGRARNRRVEFSLQTERPR